jgi:hypothetical protein
MLTQIRTCCLVAALSVAALAPVYAKDDPNQDSNSLVSYVMAAPRACLSDVPEWAASLAWLPGGNAENFPRASGSIRVAAGTKVTFGLGARSEAVWYDGAYGTIATSLVVQWRPADANDDGSDANDAAVAARHPVTKPHPWTTLGTDGAKDTRKGPSIGHGDVKVGVRFTKVGTYLVRGIVRTAAQPLYPEPLDKWHKRLGVSADRKLPDVPATVDQDIVTVKVVVTAGPPSNGGAEDVSSADPETAASQALPQDQDAQGATDASL